LACDTETDVPEAEAECKEGVTESENAAQASKGFQDHSSAILVCVSRRLVNLRLDTPPLDLWGGPRAGSPVVGDQTLNFGRADWRIRPELTIQ
jgi:hypothetical protein